MPGIEAAEALSSVWADTFESFKKDLSEKDLLAVEKITSPKDIAKHIGALEAGRHAGKGGAFADKLNAIFVD